MSAPTPQPIAPELSAERLNDASAKRQAWLDKAAHGLAHIFKSAHNIDTPPDLRVSWGFPSTRATSTKKKRVGECFSRNATTDGASEIFLHPVLANDPQGNEKEKGFTRELVIVGTLGHELGHHICGVECGHKGAFRSFAHKIGLEGKLTATMPGATFIANTAPLLAELGPFPTAGLDPTVGRKKQSTRLIKCLCAGCGYTARITLKWLTEAGSPTCPCGSMIEPEGLGPEELEDDDEEKWEEES